MLGSCATNTKVVPIKLELPKVNPYKEIREFPVYPLAGGIFTTKGGDSVRMPPGTVAVYAQDLIDVSTNLNMCLSREVILEDVIKSTQSASDD